MASIPVTAGAELLDALRDALSNSGRSRRSSGG